MIHTQILLFGIHYLGLLLLPWQHNNSSTRNGTLQLTFIRSLAHLDASVFIQKEILDSKLLNDEREIDRLQKHKLLVDQMERENERMEKLVKHKLLEDKRREDELLKKEIERDNFLRSVILKIIKDEARKYGIDEFELLDKIRGDKLLKRDIEKDKLLKKEIERDKMLRSAILKNIRDEATRYGIDVHELLDKIKRDKLLKREIEKDRLLKTEIERDNFLRSVILNIIKDEAKKHGIDEFEVLDKIKGCDLLKKEREKEKLLQNEIERDQMLRSAILRNIRDEATRYGIDEFELLDKIKGDKLLKREIEKEKLLKKEIERDKTLRSVILKNVNGKGNDAKKYVIEEFKLLENPKRGDKPIKGKPYRDKLLKNLILKNVTVRDQAENNEIKEFELLKDEIGNGQLLIGKKLKDEIEKVQELTQRLLNDEMEKVELLRNKLLHDEIEKVAYLKDKLLKDNEDKVETLMDKLLEDKIIKDKIEIDGLTKIECLIYLIDNMNISNKKKLKIRKLLNMYMDSNDPFEQVEIYDDIKDYIIRESPTKCLNKYLNILKIRQSVNYIRKTKVWRVVTNTRVLVYIRRYIIFDLIIFIFTHQIAQTHIYVLPILVAILIVIYFIVRFRKALSSVFRISRNKCKELIEKEKKKKKTNKMKLLNKRIIPNDSHIHTNIVRYY
ncbi:Plasmodium exported protein, unknown function [Plasmodium ovale]|uniref:Uncharacterized protein n=1 Tax=Plasmodium ovale TaxID=36330 RepID=A0A1C3KG26_PLAOA|nr:Plasmodium exported protein, unknown function [Plasmodium ovale]